MRAAQERLLSKEKAIAAKKNEMSELENPKDLSLHNKIVVWSSAQSQSNPLGIT